MRDWKQTVWVALALLVVACAEATMESPERQVENLYRVTDDRFRVQEDETTELDILTNDTGFEAAGYTLAIKVDPLHGTAELGGTEGHHIVYTPAQDYVGEDTLAYEITIEELVFSGAVTVLVENINDSPEANDDVVGTDQGASVSVNTTENDTDIDEDELLILASDAESKEGGFVVCYTTGICTYQPPGEFSGQDEFGYTVTDQNGGQGEARVYVNVAKDNERPVALATKLRMDEDYTGHGFLSASDSDQDALRYEIVVPTEHGALEVTPTTGVFRYYPDQDFNGTDYFWFRVFDGFGFSNTEQVEIEVRAVNDPPQASGSSHSTKENTALLLQLGHIDIDSEAVTYTVELDPGHGAVSVTEETGQVVYTPDNFFFGLDQFKFTVFDGEFTSANTATVTINVAKVNDAPVEERVHIYLNEDEGWTGNLNVYDLDLDYFSWSQVTGVSHGVLQAFNGTSTLSYASDPDYHGNDLYGYRLTDGNAWSGIGWVQFHVLPVNDDPTGGNLNVILNEDFQSVRQLPGSDRDGDELAWRIVQWPAQGTATVDSAGRLTYDPNLNSTGVDSLKYVVNDGTVDSSIYSVNYTINPVNDRPEVSCAALDVLEDDSVVGVVAASDAESPTVAINFVGNPTNGTAVWIDQINGIFRYTPNTNFNGTDQVGVRASDGVLPSFVETCVITVDPVQDKPVAFSGTNETDEDTLLAGQVGGTDVDGQTITFAAVALPQHGTLNMQTDGSFTYDPDGNYYGSDQFTFVANDGVEDSSVATYSVTVFPVNDAPYVFAAAITGNEDEVLNYQINAGDIDGDAIQYVIENYPVQGTAAISASGMLTYTPDENWFGTDSILIRVFDGTEYTPYTTIDITIESVNDVPVGQPQAITTQEDTAITWLADAEDIENDTLTYYVEVAPVNGTVIFTDAITGVYKYTPQADFFGYDSFGYRIVDENTGESEIIFVGVGVESVNDAPYSDVVTKDINEEDSFTATLVGHDVDGDELAFEAATAPTKGVLTMNPVNGFLQYTGNLNEWGTDTFWYRVSDGTAYSDYYEYTINIAEVNDKPTVPALRTAAVEEDGSVGISLTGSDVDGDTLSFVLVGSPANGSASLNTVNWTVIYSPDTNYNGTDEIQYQAQDGRGGVSSIGTLSIKVNPKNDPPTAAAVNVAGNEDRNIEGVFAGSDIDGDVLSYEITSYPSDGTVTVIGSGFVYRGDLNFSGNDSFFYRVSDGTSWSGQAAVSINIIEVNDAPTATNTSMTTNEDTAKVLAFASLFSDPEGDNVNLLVDQQPVFGTLVVDNVLKQLTYTPKPNKNGSDVFTFTGSDGDKISNIGAVSVTINPINDKPTASAHTYTGGEDQVVYGTLTGEDIDGDALTFTYTTATTVATVTVDGNSGYFTFTPDADWYGTTSFGFKVSDGTLTSLEAFITVNIIGVNDAPKVYNVTVSGPEDSTISGNMVATDIDSAVSSYQMVNPTNSGVVNYNAGNGSFTVTPNQDFAGNDAFTYKASDGDKESGIAVVTVQVTPVNDAPSAALASVVRLEDSGMYCASLALHVEDVDSSNFTYDLQGSAATEATLTLGAATGQLCIDPIANWFGSTGDSYRVCDDGTPQKCSGWYTINVDVESVNDTPVGEDVLITGILEDDPTACWGLDGHVSDVDTGDSFTYYKSGETSKGVSTIDQVTGDLCYTPNENESGIDSLSYQACDNGVPSKCTGLKTITLSINPVDDAPTAIAVDLVTLEDVTVVKTLEGFDADGDVLFFYPDTAASNGVTTLTLGGSFSYQPDENWNGYDTQYWYVCDGFGTCSDSVKITIDVKAVNDPPYVEEGYGGILEDGGTLLGTITNSDVDGDSVTVNLEIAPIHGNATVHPDGSFSYTPDANYSGNDSFKVQGCDDQIPPLCSGHKTYTVSVTAVNDPPTANSQNVNTPEEQAINSFVQGIDVDNQSGELSYALITPPNHGTIVFNNTGSYLYAPNTNFFGVDSFEWIVSDGAANSTTKTVNITVLAVNDPPTASGATIVGIEDETAVFQTTVSDVEGDTLSYAIDTQPINGSLSVTGGSYFTFVPDANWHGSDLFTYHVEDGNGGISSTKTVLLSLTNVNDAPTLSGDAIVTAEDTQGCVDMAGNTTDLDTSDSHSYAVMVSSGLGTASVSGSNVCFAPDANVNGSSAIQVAVCDNGSPVLCSSNAVITLNITAENDPPYFAGTLRQKRQFVMAGETTTVNLTGAWLDIESSVSYASTEPTVKGYATASFDGLTFTYTPDSDWYGVDESVYLACDSNALCVEEKVEWIVLPSKITVNEDETSSVTLADRDGNYDWTEPYKWQSVTTPAVGDFLLLSEDIGSIEYRAPDDYPYVAEADWEDNYVKVCSTEDTGDCSAAVNVSYEVVQVNDAPYATMTNHDPEEDTEYRIGLGIVDVDGSIDQADGFSVTITGMSSNLTDAGDGVYWSIGAQQWKLHYSSEQDQYGTGWIDIDIEDADGAVTSHRIVVDVQNVDDPIILDGPWTNDLGSNLYQLDDPGGPVITGMATGGVFTDVSAPAAFGTLEVRKIAGTCPTETAGAIAVDPDYYEFRYSLALTEPDENYYVEVAKNGYPASFVSYDNGSQQAVMRVCIHSAGGGADTNKSQLIIVNQDNDPDGNVTIENNIKVK